MPPPASRPDALSGSRSTRTYGKLRLPRGPSPTWPLIPANRAPTPTRTHQVHPDRSGVCPYAPGIRLMDHLTPRAAQHRTAKRPPNSDRWRLRLLRRLLCSCHALASGRHVQGRRNADRERRAQRALDVATASRTIKHRGRRPEKLSSGGRPRQIDTADPGTHGRARASGASSQSAARSALRRSTAEPP
jgi:hypothetical protein